MRGVLCALCLVLCATAIADTATVKANRVAVRAQPNRKSEVLLQLKKGDGVELLAAETTPDKSGAAVSGWKKIQVPDSVIVWIRKDLVARPPDVRDRGTVQKDDANVRAGPSMNFSILGKLKNGDKVEIVKEQSDWLGIKPLPGLAGWISADLIAAPGESRLGGQEVSSPVADKKPDQAPPPAPDATAPPAKPSPVTPPAPAANPEGVIVTHEGTLRAHSGIFQRPGTHELWNEKALKASLLCYLDSKEHNLARYVGKHVQITGEERPIQGWNKPLVDVATIKVVE